MVSGFLARVALAILILVPVSYAAPVSLVLSNIRTTAHPACSPGSLSTIGPAVLADMRC